jgi:hypothetical protein
LVEAVWDQNVPYPVRLRGVVINTRLSISPNGKERDWRTVDVIWVNYINNDVYKYYDDELILIAEA